MILHLYYKGYHPQRAKPYLYKVISENGKVDEFEEAELITSKEIEVDDRLFGDTSGWADIECDECGYVFSDRTWQGSSLACPVCGHAHIVPEDAVLYDVYNNSEGMDYAAGTS